MSFFANEAPEPTPLPIKMKKQQLRHTTLNAPIYTIGEVNLDLAVWDFSEDEDLTCHIAEQLAKAIYLHYNMSNFGPESFGIQDEEF